jgi:hypothetical protein
MIKDDFMRKEKQYEDYKNKLKSIDDIDKAKQRFVQQPNVGVVI